MNVQLSRNEIIDLIKSVPLAYRRYKPELEMAGEWSYNMDGPTHFSWYTRHLLSFSEEELYEFYLKLKNGEFYLPDQPQAVKNMTRNMANRSSYAKTFLVQFSILG